MLKRIATNGTSVLGFALASLVLLNGCTAESAGSEDTTEREDALVSLTTNTGNPSFGGWPNGNEAGSVEVSHRWHNELFYFDSSVTIMAHWMPWFCTTQTSTLTTPDGSHPGCNSHGIVGYNSWDDTVIARQLDDMQGRGINGVVVDWYYHEPCTTNPDGSLGPPVSTTYQFHNCATQHLAKALAARGMKLAIMIDKGSITSNYNCSGCSNEQIIEKQMDYIHNTFYLPYKSNYLTWTGPSGGVHPVIYGFDIYSALSGVNWQNVGNHANAAGWDPILAEENLGSFTHPWPWSGGFYWNSPGDGADWDPGQKGGIDYFADGFSYGNTRLLTLGAMRHFDDRMATWSQNRDIYQECGQMWIKSWAEWKSRLSSDYGSSFRPNVAQLITWNDYEEGTELETGIDNCLSSITGTVSGSTLSWTPSWSSSYGSDTTLYGWEIYDSTGTKIGTPGPTARSFTLPNTTTGPWQVKAIGKPSIRNTISGAIGSASGTTIHPNTGVAASNTTWGSNNGSSCSGAMWSCVDDTSPDNDATYVYATAAGGYHTVAYTSAPSTTVTHVTATIYGAGSGTATLSLYSNGTLLATGAAHTLGSGYAAFQDTFTIAGSAASSLQTKVTFSASGAKYTDVYLVVQ